MRKLKFVSVFVLLALLLSAGPGAVMGQEPPPVPPQPAERPRELREVEYQAKVADLYAQHPDLRVIVDLEDTDGIDPNLLPPDVASLVDSNTKVVAFRETARLDSGRVPGLASLCAIPSLDIWCKSPDGSRDMTVSKWYGGVEQFCRVYALLYDDYPGAPDFHGWEIEQQWSRWTRTDSSWTVHSARMWTLIPGEDYCTEDDATLNHGSTDFTPTWDGNGTNWWTISGFANNAYVPFPHGWSWTQGDIYQNSSLKYNDAQTRQGWPNH